MLVSERSRHRDRDRHHAEAALEHGVYGYVLEPFKPNELVINVVNALRRRTLEIGNRGHLEQLQQTVLERTSSLRETIARLESSESELRRLREVDADTGWLRIRLENDEGSRLLTPSELFELLL